MTPVSDPNTYQQPEAVTSYLSMTTFRRAEHVRKLDDPAFLAELYNHGILLPDQSEDGSDAIKDACMVFITNCFEIIRGSGISWRDLKEVLKERQIALFYRELVCYDQIMISPKEEPFDAATDADRRRSIQERVASLMEQENAASADQQPEETNEPG
jgi:hypothetical protein